MSPNAVFTVISGRADRVNPDEKSLDWHFELCCNGDTTESMLSSRNRRIQDVGRVGLRVCV